MLPIIRAEYTVNALVYSHLHTSIVAGNGPLGMQKIFRKQHNVSDAIAKAPDPPHLAKISLVISIRYGD